MNFLNSVDEKIADKCQVPLIDVDKTDGSCMQNTIKKEPISMELRENCNVIINENYRRSAESLNNQYHPDVIKMKLTTEKNGHAHNGSVEVQRSPQSPPPTSYTETLIHLFKGNVGPGCLAMPHATKNGGLLLAPFLTLFLAITTVHVQHILLNCSDKMRIALNLQTRPDYAETVELCFASSSSEKYRKRAKLMKKICNIFICITQLGFCCIYFLFITTNLKQVLDFYGLVVNFYVLIVLVLIPIWLASLITNLKYLAPCSGIANFCMITGLIISYYYSSIDLPPISERNFLPTSLHQLPLYFGTTIFGFEGIALVLPLQNAMRIPKNFDRTFGVLNVGMVFVSSIFISFGFIGYWKYGELTAPSLTLNLPIHEIPAQIVKIAISMGVLLGYPIQFFIAIQIMFPTIKSQISLANSHPYIGELFFRSLMVLVTFAVAIAIPQLDLLLSLIGAVCSTILALVLPPLLEFIIMPCDNNFTWWWLTFKNSVILIIALLGFLTGGYESLMSIFKFLF